uniref:DNA-(apurinic or apyrimidinic site) endonuclease 2 n=1 Tax=Saimiri boliviensis boliviensis TaxID=39432 RepID=A0A2K6S098_SAIBB
MWGNQEPNNCAAVAVGRILDELDADIVCLQETKVTRDALTEPLAITEGCNSYFSFSRNRSDYFGVATFCKDSAIPVAAEEGLSGLFAAQNGDFTQEELRSLDSEGRALINVYCPHMRFYRLLQMRAEGLLAADSHVIILGDLNTAHRPIEHWDSVNLECFKEDPGHKWMDGLLNNLGCQSASHAGPFIDSYHCFQAKQEGAFTCWSAVTGARHLSFGSQIDYVLGDRTLVIDTFQASFLLPEVMGSDHCPVGAVLSVTSVPVKQCPLLCTRFLPEFLKVHRFLSAPLHNSQTREQTCENKARVRSTRPRPSQLGSSRGQKTLKSCFQPSPTLPQASPDIELPSLSLVSALMTPKTSEEEAKGQAKASEAKDEKEVRTSFWKSFEILGPLPIPSVGARETCVMPTMRKPGPNLGRRFYMYARPRGPPNDPSSRCNFFLWSRPS